MSGRFHRLGESDLSALRFESVRAPAQVGGLGIIEAAPLVDASGHLRIDHVRARIESRLPLVPQLRRKLMFPGFGRGRALWVDDARFNIANHVVESTVPPPGGEAELLQACADTWPELLDRSRPLWELRFFSGMSGNRLGVTFKLHHALADGTAIVAMMQALFDFEAEAADPEVGQWTPEPAPEAKSLVADNLSTRLHGMVKGIRRLPHIRGVISGFATFVSDIRMTLRFGSEAPKTSFNRRVSGRRMVRYLKTDLEDVRKVAHASGGKVNDVVLDLVTAGLRDLLVGRREPVDGVQLKASVPVSLRRSADAKDLGNESGALVIPLPVFEADARRCLELIVAGTAKAKAEQRPAYGQAFMSWLSRLPIAQQFIDRQRFINVLVTNVMGPPVPMYLLGARIQEVVPVIQLAGNLTLTFCAFSYAESLYIVATADAVACPDVDTVKDGMERAWRSLRGPAAVTV